VGLGAACVNKKGVDCWSKKRGKIDTGLTPCPHGIFIGFRISMIPRINLVYIQITICAITESFFDTTFKKYFLYIIVSSIGCLY